MYLLGFITGFASGAVIGMIIIHRMVRKVRENAKRIVGI
jgi:hypothetical protein